MANTFTLSVVAPDRSVIEQPVTSAILPGEAGYFGILAGHLPMVATLRPGLLEYQDTNMQRNYVALSGGFAEVTPGKVTVLADAAEKAQEIDVARAERALEEARKALRGEAGAVNTEEATHELERAMNRLKAARGSS